MGEGFLGERAVRRLSSTGVVRLFALPAREREMRVDGDGMREPERAAVATDPGRVARRLASVKGSLIARANLA